VNVISAPDVQVAVKVAFAPDSRVSVSVRSVIVLEGTNVTIVVTSDAPGEVAVIVTSSASSTG
jgi:hypothetical protein